MRIRDKFHMQLDSSFNMNSIILVTSDREGDGGQTRRLDEDLQVITTSENCIYWHEEISNKHHFIMYMEEIKKCIKNEGMKPIIHFHMHGGKGLGLEIGATDEYISWTELSVILRDINVLLENNLCVVSTACHAFHMISDITITQPSPFFCFIASQEEVGFGYIDDNASKFYKSLFSTGSLDQAFGNISDMFNYYHSEKMLVIALTKYIINACKGKLKNQRKEELLSSAISGGMPNTPESLKEIRAMIKTHITPDQDLLNRYIDQFLIGKPISITIDGILDLVESSYA